MLRSFMTGMSKNQTSKYSKAFLKRLLDRDKFFESGLEAIGAHKKKGDMVVIATASMDFYVEDIAKKLGADHIIATTSVWRRGIMDSPIVGFEYFLFAWYASDGSKPSDAYFWVIFAFWNKKAIAIKNKKKRKPVTTCALNISLILQEAHED